VGVRAPPSTVRYRPKVGRCQEPDRGNGERNKVSPPRACLGGATPHRGPEITSDKRLVLGGSSGSTVPGSLHRCSTALDALRRTSHWGSCGDCGSASTHRSELPTRWWPSITRRRRVRIRGLYLVERPCCCDPLRLPLIQIDYFYNRQRWIPWHVIR
jgi:hypothetical protein